MHTLNNLLLITNRIIIIYPLYNEICEELENFYPLVKKVRKYPELYNGTYISNNRISGESNLNDEHIIELFTEYNDRHVEVICKIYRKRPIFWEIEKQKYIGYTLSTVSKFDVDDPTIYKID